MNANSSVFEFLKNYEIGLSNLSERLKCLICQKLLKNAKQTKCGCKVCENCIIQYLSSGPKCCPSTECTDIILNMNQDIYSDNATNKEIAFLKVNCPFEGCIETDSLIEISIHINSCQYRDLVCELCKQKYPAKDKSMHDKDKCEMRQTKCQFCNKSMTVKYLNDIHFNFKEEDMCSKFQDFCPNNCEVTEKLNVKNHLKTCVNKKMSCPFYNLDCNMNKMSRDDLNSHIQETNISHLSFVVNEIASLRQTLKDLQTKIDNQNNIIQDMGMVIKTLTDNSTIVTEKIKELHEKQLSPIKLISKTIGFRNGNFIWKIRNFKSLKQNAVHTGQFSITSDAFYTSEFGYKLCLLIYPNGDGFGKGTHLSIFFILMKGEYDDLLTWPFRQKVTLTLLDQETFTKNYANTFKPDPKSECFQKPIEDCNVASGSPRFYPLAQLYSNSLFYKNDTVYIKISVDMSVIHKP